MIITIILNKNTQFQVAVFKAILINKGNFGIFRQGIHSYLK